MSGNKQPVSVLVLIHTRSLDVLLLERVAHPGYWQSVTGSREGRESLVETACREIREETGITAEPGQLQNWKLSNTYEIFPEWRNRYPEGITHNQEHVFSLQLDEATQISIAPDEHRAWQWANWRTAAEYCFSWSNRDAILMLPKRFAHRS